MYVYIGQVNKNLDDLKKSVSSGKTLVANAITAQGVNTSTSATFKTIAANIGTACTNKYNTGYSTGYSARNPSAIWEGYIGGYVGAPWSVQVSTSNGNFIIEELSCWVVTGGSLNWSKHEYGKSWSNNVLTINANATEANRNEKSFKAYIRVWKF